MRAANQLIFWRIVPVGFATAFLSGCILGLLSISLTVKGWENVTSLISFLFPALSLGMLALLFFGVVGWLPLMVLWNAAVVKLRKRFGLVRAAVGLSTGMAFALIAVASIVFVGWDGADFRQFRIFGIWSICTALIAGGLSHFVFRNVIEDKSEC